MTSNPPKCASTNADYDSMRYAVINALTSISQGLLSKLLHRRAKEILADVSHIQAYLALTDAQPAMVGLTDKLFRARRQITETSLDARRAIERALRETNSSSMDEIEDLPTVRISLDKRDQTQRQLGPVVEDLQDRIAKVRAILEKYNKIEI